MSRWRIGSGLPDVRHFPILCQFNSSKEGIYRRADTTLCLQFPRFYSGTYILWLLEELGLEYSLNHMEFHPRALKSDEHRIRHPLGRVPVLDDDDISLFESGAIVEYLVARHSDGALRPAQDSPLFPEYLQWFHYVEGMIMPPINTIVVQTILLPEDRRDPEVLRQAQSLLKKALAPVDAALEGREYMIGDFSAADIMMGHACFMSRR